MGMRLKTFLSAVVSTAALAGSAAQLFAQPQSLGDLARQEEERRQAVKQPAKVYTNKDLGNVPPAPPAPPPETQKPPSTSAGDASKAVDKEKGKEGDKPATKDQAYWAGQVKQLQEQLDRDQTHADAMQSRINGLSADFAARDDPAQRAVIESDRRKALAELDRLKQAIVADKKAIADLQDEARRTGVPPGWLR